MEIFLDPHDEEAKDAPEYVRKGALEANKQILKIVWDQDGGYPEHAWGYVQWSIRPYEQRYGCDGTTDLNIHLIALRLCESLGLDYVDLYERTYAEHDGFEYGDSWLRHRTPTDWESIEAQTIVPEPSEQALRNVLYDLGEINHHSLVRVLETEFTKRGYEVTDW